MIRAKIEFELAALADFESARVWYLAADPQVALRFIDEVEASIERIAEAPERWPLFPGIEVARGVRRFVIREFPFVVAYLVTDRAVRVLAIAHTHREPAFWLGRIERGH